ncbi:MAG: dCTP deaminase, partial [Deltaproteobacteria bacterium]|nr:dCTP deaminase [Deltaproteobacteria bacterium]
MCVLTRGEIEKEIDSGRLRIDPFDPSQIGPASIDLHLG